MGFMSCGVRITSDDYFDDELFSSEMGGIEGGHVGVSVMSVII